MKIRKTDKKDDVVYPCLMELDSGEIVLFPDKNRGTVIVAGNNYSVGFHSSSWDATIHNIYTGTVTIST